MKPGGRLVYATCSILPDENEAVADAFAAARPEFEALSCAALLAVQRIPLDTGERLLVLFLGSTIGNFDRPAGVKFLASVRDILLPGDSLLLGTDLEKPLPQLLPAYDDPLGVTASFNLNLLARINRELGANFVLSRFRHEARYDKSNRRVEMHLPSLVDHTVTIPKAGVEVHFRKDETIWTESSHKYSAQEMSQIAKDAGFFCKAQWIDRDWPFAENLFVAE